MSRVVKFFLKPGPISDIEVAAPENRSLEQLMLDVKMLGYFCNEVVFIPYASIIAVAYGEGLKMTNLAAMPTGTKQ